MMSGSDGVVTRPLAVDGIVFDCDGVLVDSAASVEHAWRRWSDQFALDADAVLQEAFGRPSRETAAAWLPADLVAEACDVVDQMELADARNVGPMAGVPDLLKALPRSRWAIFTSASRQLLEARMRAAGLPMPDIAITSDDVVRGKPDPEGYATALRMVGVAGESAVVFEDTKSGMHSARAAGVRTIIRVGAGVPTDGELAVVQDLRGVTWNGVLNVAGQWRQGSGLP